MTDITRRKFLSLAPASVGAFALGVVGAKASAPEPLPPLVVADTGPIRDLAHLEGERVTVLGDAWRRGDVPGTPLRSAELVGYADGQPFLNGGELLNARDAMTHWLRMQDHDPKPGMYVWGGLVFRVSA